MARTEQSFDFLGDMVRKVSAMQGGDADEARRRFLRIARVGVPMSASDFDEIATAP